MTDARWAAVVVNYNAGTHLADGVRSLVGDDSAGKVDVVVVDNGSDDDSLERVAALDVGAHIVHATRNLGYARGANLGIATTTAAVVAVLNADVVVAHGTAKAMLAALDADPRVGAVGPRIVDAHGNHYPSAREVPGLATSAGHALLSIVAPRNRWSRRYRQEHIDPDRARRADWVSGAALWMRRDALDDIGGWDERFFMFLEDVDLCARLREHGWTVLYEPAGHVMHIEGVSRRRHPVRMLVEHHRAAYRYANLHWRGPKRLLLPVTALVLAARTGALLLVAQLRRVLARS
jgi:N-acetylglucosaminyl-diphospho-decaprenol L-rhamnosyltransferase